jgi:putative lipoic acid-binding regulatory protein
MLFDFNMMIVARTRSVHHVNPLPHLELLEATHVFPGQYVFKAIGRHNDDFIDGVVAAVRVELGCDFDPPIALNPSSGGRHVAITIEPRVESAAQVLAIYQRLRGVDGLVLLL